MVCAVIRFTFVIGGGCRIEKGACTMSSPRASNDRTTSAIRSRGRATASTTPIATAMPKRTRTKNRTGTRMAPAGTRR